MLNSSVGSSLGLPPTPVLGSYALCLLQQPGQAMRGCAEGSAAETTMFKSSHLRMLNSSAAGIICPMLPLMPLGPLNLSVYSAFCSSQQQSAVGFLQQPGLPRGLPVLRADVAQQAWASALCGSQAQHCMTLSETVRQHTPADGCE